MSLFGIKKDPNTVYEFASDGNFCHHASPAAPPTYAQQNEFCLFDKHNSCPIFLLAEKKPLPIDIAYSGKQRLLRENIIYSSVGALFLLLAVGLAAAIAILGNLSSVSAIPEGTITIRTRTPTAAVTSRPVQTDSANPGASPVGTHNPAAVGCTPPDGWIVYYVIPGDTVYRLSLIFGIRETELEKANCMENNHILRSGDLIYVPSFIIFSSTGIPTSTATMQLKPTSTVRIIPFNSPTPTREFENRPPTAVPPTAVPLPTDTQVPAPPTALPTPTFPPPPPTDAPLPTNTPPPPTDTPSPTNTPLPSDAPLP